MNGLALQEDTRDLLADVRDGVLWLTLNRPSRRNATTPAIFGALAEALDEAEHDDGVGAVVLTGAGQAFCSGGDVKNMAGRDDWRFEDHLAYFHAVHVATLKLARFPKITIAMVNGACFGAGLSLALACDMRIAARSAMFGTAFARVGLASDHGGTWSLARLVGPAKAKELYLLAEPFDAESALAWGIVSRVAENAALRVEVARLAARFASGPRFAYGLIKRAIDTVSSGIDFAAALDLEAEAQSRAMMSADHREARTAFLEKRAPVFIGRGEAG